MSNTFLSWLLAAGMLVNIAAIAQAQNPTTAQATAAPNSGNYNNATAAIQNGPNTVTLSGCLRRGTGSSRIKQKNSVTMAMHGS